ncbi:hypothetical protein NS201_23845, partial [Pseudomonas oryzihabitans]
WVGWRSQLRPAWGSCTGVAGAQQGREGGRQRDQRVQIDAGLHADFGAEIHQVLGADVAGGARREGAATEAAEGGAEAPGASGNICTEDLVNLCAEIGVETGIDLDRLIALSRTLPALLGHDTPGQVAKAGRNCDLHPPPAASG